MQFINPKFMRKNDLLLIATMLLWGGFSSCSDTGDEPSNIGSVRFYGESYPLEQGAIYHDNNHSVIETREYVFEDIYQYAGTTQKDLVKGFTAEMKNGQTGNFLLGLYESGFRLSELTKDARGSGACVCLRLASPETDRIVPGKYTFSLNRDGYTFKGYSSGKYYSGETATSNEFTEGEVEITCQDDIYTIDFHCKNNFGGVTEGNYTGRLKTFDIRKEFETLYNYENIRLEGLFDRVDYTDAEGVPHSEPDYLRATSFFASRTQKVYSANLYRNLAESVKKGIDIALAYDKTKEALYFESPIKMRALLWHNTFDDENLSGTNFDLPCHTKYMPAPQDFTNEDFEALNRQEDFVFDFVEKQASIPIGSSLPCFIIVRTGNGSQGVIRIKEIVPESTEMIGGITYPVNPSILMDIKFPRSYSEQKLR